MLQVMTTLAQNYDGGVGILGGGLMCCASIFVLLFFVFWLWMLIDCITREFPGPNDKIVWILVIIFLNWIGALIYFFVGRPRGTRT